MVRPKSEPIRILLFENTQADAKLMEDYLKQTGLPGSTTVAGGLGEGIQKARTNHFDLILLNLSQPESRGIATLRSVRECAGDAAIIVLTESEDESLSTEALQAGAQDHLCKDNLGAEVLRRSILYGIERARLIRRLETHAGEIEHSEALLRRVFEVNTDAMLILKEDYEIRFLNPAAAELLDADADSLVGETFPFEVGTSEVSELEIPETNGGIRVVEISAVDLVWEGERARLVLLRDITRRRTAELRLKREKERMAAVYDLIADAVIATDQNNMVERINREASRLTGVAAEKASGKPLSQILRLQKPQTGKLIKDPLEDLLNPDYAEAYASEGVHLSRQGASEPGLVTVKTHFMVDEFGGHQGGVIVLREISKQKKVEDELFETEKANSINVLASGIAHDFNNMLTAILGNISLIRMNVEEENPMAKPLRAVETAALQAKSLTQQLLTFSKGGTPTLETTTLDQLVEECAQFILRGSNVKCVLTKEESLWAVDADKGQISQVVNNLIINSDQAMPSGGTIHLNLGNRQLRKDEVPGLAAGDYVCIEVRDQGVGISPENLNRIFEPYFTTKKDGNGLGLASSSTIIRSHKGAMTVESELDKGTVFRVYLPRAEKPREPASVRETKSQSNESRDLHRGKGRILVMDDMEPMMMVAGEILNALGYEVEFATNGEEAIEAYKKARESGNAFDACVFDLTVPGGMGGEEASEILIQYDPDLIAIASSGYTTSNVMSNYENSAFKAVVPKPYRIKEMSDALDRALHGEEG